jgi:hypothetical protein
VLRQFEQDNFVAMKKGADNLAPLVFDNTVELLIKVAAQESDLRCVFQCH